MCIRDRFQRYARGQIDSQTDGLITILRTNTLLGCRLQQLFIFHRHHDSDAVSQRRQRRTEPQPKGDLHTSVVKIGPAVPEICSRTDRLTDRRVDHSTPHPYRCWVINADKTKLLISRQIKINWRAVFLVLVRTTGKILQWRIRLVNSEVEPIFQHSEGPTSFIACRNADVSERSSISTMLCVNFV